MKFSETDSLDKNEDILSSKIDDEIVMMSIDHGKYYGLDSIGSRIWELLDQTRTLTEIIEILTKEFDVSKEQCSQDCYSFINDLIKKKIIFVRHD